MSRHRLKPLASNAEPVEVTVGWDPALESYFLIVVGQPAATEGRVKIWMGSEARSEPEPERVLAAARQWSEVPEKLVETLLIERRAPRLRRGG